MTIRSAGLRFSSNRSTSSRAPILVGGIGARLGLGGRVQRQSLGLAEVAPAQLGARFFRADLFQAGVHGNARDPMLQRHFPLVLVEMLKNFDQHGLGQDPPRWCGVEDGNERSGRPWDVATARERGRRPRPGPCRTRARQLSQSNCSSSVIPDVIVFYMLGDPAARPDGYLDSVCEVGQPAPKACNRLVQVWRLWQNRSANPAFHLPVQSVFL